MEEAKEIIAQFIGTEAANISNSTVIDKTVVKGSILIHRMYAALATAGVSANNYTDIVTYGDLINRLVGDGGHSLTNSADIDLDDEVEGDIGVDIEKSDNLPDSADYREDEFYKQNFTSKEISYCSLKKYPKESFLGLFCAKEALVKTSPALANKKFNQIEINHTAKGKPVYEGYLISISHTEGTAVAVATKQSKAGGYTLPAQYPSAQKTAVSQTAPSKMPVVLALLSLFISIVLLVLYLIK